MAQTCHDCHLLYKKLYITNIKLDIYYIFRWHGGSDEAFPTLGGGAGGAVVAPAPVWGPKR